MSFIAHNYFWICAISPHRTESIKKKAENRNKDLSYKSLVKVISNGLKWPLVQPKFNKVNTLTHLIR